MAFIVPVDLIAIIAVPVVLYFTCRYVNELEKERYESLYRELQFNNTTR